MGEPVRWSDEAREVISGDITTAAAYLTPAGRAVVTAVATFGIADRGRGMVGFTTSLGPLHRHADAAGAGWMATVLGGSVTGPCAASHGRERAQAGSPRWGLWFSCDAT